MHADSPRPIQLPPSMNAESLRRSHGDLTWSAWYLVPAPPAAALPQWEACADCGTRRPPIATQGRDAQGVLQAVVSFCPDCEMASTLHLAGCDQTRTTATH